MLDIKKIRADFDGVAAKLATRGVEKEKLEKLHDLSLIHISSKCSDG